MSRAGFNARSRLAIVPCLLALAACASPPAEPGAAVVATIAPLASIAREIVGDAGHVATLLPPGASPHTFEPLPRDLARLRGASLLIRVGAGLDEWSEKLFAGEAHGIRSVEFMALPAASPLPWPTSLDAAHGDHDHGGVSLDPHIWLDPIRVRDGLAPALVDALCDADAEGCPAFRERGTRLAERLTELDEAVRARLAGLSTRAFVAYHDTWRYFSARYDLEMVGAIETYAGDEPSAAELGALIAAARARRVRVVLLEPQLGERVARTIAAELDATIAIADPLGNPSVPERADYFAMMRYNAEAIARASSGDSR